jgi:hypothetical protein
MLFRRAAAAAVTRFHWTEYLRPELCLKEHTRELRTLQTVSWLFSFEVEAMQDYL